MVIFNVICVSLLKKNCGMHTCICVCSEMKSNILIQYLHMNIMGQSVHTGPSCVQHVSSCCPISASPSGYPGSLYQAALEGVKLSQGRWVQCGLNGGNKDYLKLLQGVDRGVRVSVH